MPSDTLRASQKPGSAPLVQITVNGEARNVAPGTTVAALLAVMNLAGKRIAVERNGDIVPKGRHADTLLAPGDRLEVVVAVGGG